MCEELQSGLSYNWICSDPLNRVAVFSSGSFARIPRIFATDLEKYEREVRPLVDDLLDNYPLVTDYRLGNNPTANDQIRLEMNIFQTFAKQGLYVFDVAQHIQGIEYYLAYLPEQPLTIDAFDRTKSSFLRRHRVQKTFEETPLVTQLEAIKLFD